MRDVDYMCIYVYTCVYIYIYIYIYAFILGCVFELLLNFRGIFVGCLKGFKVPGTSQKLEEA